MTRKVTTATGPCRLGHEAFDQFVAIGSVLVEAVVIGLITSWSGPRRASGWARLIRKAKKLVKGAVKGLGSLPLVKAIPTKLEGAVRPREAARRGPAANAPHPVTECRG